MVYVKIRSASTKSEMRSIDNEMEQDDWTYLSKAPAIKINGVYYRYYEKTV